MAKPQPTNGWRLGYDPVQRWLRIITTVVCLGLFVYLSTNPNRTVNDLPTLALALGSVLLLLGYEGIVRLPMLNKPEAPKPNEDEK